MNSGRHVQYTEQPQQLFTDRFVDFHQTKHCSDHLLTPLKHHMKAWNLLYNST
jgi:hypothetical protein